MTQSYLAANDERWECRNVIELSSASEDPDKFGIGSSPWKGDTSSTGVVVPSVATTAQTNRYLIRLCAVDIPKGKALLVHAIRQYATIRQVETIEPANLLRPAELPVTTPTWAFTNGNISWHLRKKAQGQGARVADAAQVPGTSPDVDGLDSALLYVPPLVPYVAPGAGIPLGSGISTFGTWRDMRFPWDSADVLDQSLLVTGPGAVVYYASVHQTNPVGRPILTVADSSALSPEDRFLATFQDAVYGRVAGTLLVETVPCCPEYKP